MAEAFLTLMYERGRADGPERSVHGELERQIEVDRIAVDALGGALRRPLDANEPPELIDVVLRDLESGLPPGASHHWLLSAQPALGGQRPVDLLAANRIDEVRAAASQLTPRRLATGSGDPPD